MCQLHALLTITICFFKDSIRRGQKTALHQSQNMKTRAERRTDGLESTPLSWTQRLSVIFQTPSFSGAARSAAYTSRAPHATLYTPACARVTSHMICQTSKHCVVVHRLFTVLYVLFPFCVSYCWFTGIIAPQTSTRSHVFAVRTAKYLLLPAWQSIDALCCAGICCVERLDGAASLKHPERRENV